MREFRTVCGTCETDAQIVSETDGNVAVCPTCGQRDSLQNAERIAAEHQMQCAIADLHDGARKVLERKGVRQAPSESQPRPTFKWHAAPL